MRLDTLLEATADRLRPKSDTAELDAQVLLANILGKPRSWVMAHPEAEPAPDLLAALDGKVARFEQGEPLPYILGRWEFFGLEFEVTPDVLIPRPETELLVEKAIAWLQAHPAARLALDAGTGSGCIAISLAVNVADLHVTATDISPQALAVARRNAEKLNVADRITFLEADLIPDPLFPDSFSLIVANLPYIPTNTLHGLPIYGREPTLALDGGADGLSLIRKLLERIPERLAPGGLLLMEIEASEGPAVVSLAYDAFSEAEIHLHQDLAGHERLLEVIVTG